MEGVTSTVKADYAQSGVFVKGYVFTSLDVIYK